MKIRNHIASSEVGGKVFLTYLKDGKRVFHELNRTCGDVWKLLPSGRDAGSIAEWIHGKYDVSLAKAQEDVVRTINEFRDLGLLEE
jgi:Coenzyme PQQ synthesis protein D (PqqD)